MALDWFQSLSTPSVLRKKITAAVEGSTFTSVPPVLSLTSGGNRPLSTGAFSSAFSSAFSYAALDWLNQLSLPSVLARRMTAAVAVTTTGAIALQLPIGSVQELITVNKWYQPLSAPVFARRSLLPALTPVSAQVPTTAKEPVSADRWVQPLSTPVTARPRQQPHYSSLVWPLTLVAPESSWHQPFSQHPGLPRNLHASQQQAHTGPVSQSLEPATVDRWYSPFPVSVPPRRWLLVADQAAFTWHISTSIERTSLDRWFSPLSLPPGNKRALSVADQMALIAVTSQAKEVTTIDRWYQPFQMVVPWPRKPHASEHPAFTWHISTAKEATTADRWFWPLSMPVWARQALPVADHQAFSAVTLSTTSVAATLVITEASDTLPGIAGINITEQPDVLHGIVALSFRFSDTLRTNIIAQTNITIGSAGILKLFSGSLPATCELPDPSGQLCVIPLPATFLTSSLGTATLAGTWVATTSQSGTVASFRFYDGSGVCHIQGTVADIGLSPTSFNAGQTLRITSFFVVAPG
ncbi:MAG TPA: hypothetical protein VH024_17480 [Candidatus Angelobacter sp.]|jgi:hypothetical protein|nr:hypothetical protein [Candidatus Angelobacter sp.]